MRNQKHIDDIIKYHIYKLEETRNRSLTEEEKKQIEKAINGLSNHGIEYHNEIVWEDNNSFYFKDWIGIDPKRKVPKHQLMSWIGNNIRYLSNGNVERNIGLLQRYRLLKLFETFKSLMLYQDEENLSCFYGNIENPYFALAKSMQDMRTANNSQTTPDGEVASVANSANLETWEQLKQELSQNEELRAWFLNSVINCTLVNRKSFNFNVIVKSGYNGASQHTCIAERDNVVILYNPERYYPYVKDEYLKLFENLHCYIDIQQLYLHYQFLDSLESEVYGMQTAGLTTINCEYYLMRIYQLLCENNHMTFIRVNTRYLRDFYYCLEVVIDMLPYDLKQRIINFKDYNMVSYKNDHLVNIDKHIAEIMAKFLSNDLEERWNAEETLLEKQTAKAKQYLIEDNLSIARR